MKTTHVTMLVAALMALAVLGFWLKHRNLAEHPPLSQYGIPVQGAGGLPPPGDAFLDPDELGLGSGVDGAVEDTGESRDPDAAASPEMTGADSAPADTGPLLNPEMRMSHHASSQEKPRNAIQDTGAFADPEREVIAAESTGNSPSDTGPVIDPEGSLP